MIFRFGRRKEQKNSKPDYERANEDNLVNVPDDTAASADEAVQLHALHGQPASVAGIVPRILVFGDHEETGNLYSLFLRSKGYEVLHFPAPATCALMAQQYCTCPRDHVCADILLTEMVMDGMTGLELIRLQADRGCRTLSKNKVVIATGLTHRQEYEARELGCKVLCKPFRLMDLLAWVSRCEQSITPDRQLTPYHELIVPSPP